jgi:hypothetical protein
MDETPSSKICRVCNTPKELILFATYKDRVGNLHTKNICNKCNNKQRTERYKVTPRSPERQERIKEKLRRYRADPEKCARFILGQSRITDKRKGRANDLTRDFIEAMIINGCSYCGQIEGRMTLDRIDNSIGHLQNNVQPACLRCNYIRRDIPYEAWLALVPAVKEARIRGLFGTWNGSWVKPKGIGEATSQGLALF